MVVSVGHDDILVPAQAEPVGRVELTLGLTQLTELGPHLHRPHARHQSVGCVGHPQDPGVGVLAQTTLVHLQTGQATAAKSVVYFIINATFAGRENHFFGHGNQRFIPVP